MDAHIGGSGVIISVGAIIRDNEGRMLVGAVRKYKGTWDVGVAEACAARFGVSLATRFGYRNVILESDSMMVAQGVDQRKQGKTPLYMLFDDICRLCYVFSNVISFHVKTSGNC